MECNPQSVPLALDLVDTWASGTTLTGKAVRVKLGTPGQDVLLFPAFTQDDLHVHNRSVQYIEQPLTSLDLEGLGDYDWTQSSTFSPTTLSSWNGTKPNRDPDLHSAFNDALQVDEKLNLDGFPMFTALQPRGYFLDNLPLSYSSVFMRSLLSTGQILSRVIGYWPGSRDLANNASLVLGGYDNSRAYPEEWYTINTVATCYTCANVTGLTFNGPNGTVDLFDGREDALPVAFEMAFPDIKLDTAIMENLMRATGAEWNATLRRLVYPSRPQGNITVTLHNNYTTTILNEELFIPRPVLMENSTIAQDPDLYVALVGNNTLEGEPRMWGRPFLSMNYFLADWSRLQIHLSPAIRERPSGFDFGIQLVPLCEPQNMTNNGTATSASSSNNTASIAGGVVGGIIGLVFILALGLFYIRRRKRAETGPEDFAKPELENTAVSATTNDPRDGRKIGELDSKLYVEIDSASPQELPSAYPLELGSAILPELGSAILPELGSTIAHELDSDPRGEITGHENEKVNQHVSDAGTVTGSPHKIEADPARTENSIQSTPITLERRLHVDE